MNKDDLVYSLNRWAAKLIQEWDMFLVIEFSIIYDTKIRLFFHMNINKLKDINLDVYT